MTSKCDNVNFSADLSQVQKCSNRKNISPTPFLVVFFTLFCHFQKKGFYKIKDMFLFVERNTLRQQRKGKKNNHCTTGFFSLHKVHILISYVNINCILKKKKVLVLFFMKKRKKIHVKEIFQINLVENVSTQVFC